MVRKCRLPIPRPRYTIWVPVLLSGTLSVLWMAGLGITSMIR
ncbi:hypothetical protein [Sedimentimonas flavescens]|nr:hypothetical protein [Sedimentimonas flavescens]MCT2538501.1 hypothetical protein [Sedimentimonas flavescens]